MTKPKYDFVSYNPTRHGITIRLRSNHGEVFYYYETLGTVDVRDEGGLLVGGEIYDEIYEFVEEKLKTLVNLYETDHGN